MHGRHFLEHESVFCGSKKRHWWSCRLGEYISAKWAANFRWWRVRLASTRENTWSKMRSSCER